MFPEKSRRDSTSLGRLLLPVGETTLIFAADDDDDTASSKLAGITKFERNPSEFPRKSAGELFCRKKPASNELVSAEEPNGTEPLVVDGEEFSVRSCVKHCVGFNNWSSSSSSSSASNQVAGAERNRASPPRLTPAPLPLALLLLPRVCCICLGESERVTNSGSVVFRCLGFGLQWRK